MFFWGLSAVSKEDGFVGIDTSDGVTLGLSIDGLSASLIVSVLENKEVTMLNVITFFNDESTDSDCAVDDIDAQCISLVDDDYKNLKVIHMILIISLICLNYFV